MLEEAVRDADALPRTPDPHATRMQLGAQAPGCGAEIPRRGSDVPHRGREAKGQARDVEVLDLLAVHEVRPLPGLDAGNVRVGVMREAEVQPSAFAFLLEPEFPVRVVQVMRFVLEVVAHVAHDHAAGAAAGPAREAQAVLFQVHDFHPRGVGLAHDPAELGPDQRPLEVVFGLVLDVFGIDAEVDLLAGRVLDGVPEGLARVVPDPPFALHVVGVGAFPVGGARQRDAEEIAFLADEPHAARREVQVGPPDFLRLGDVLVRRTLLPAGDAFRSAEDRGALAPARIAREADRVARLAGLAHGQFAAVIDAAFEDVGVDTATDLGLAGRLGVPGVVFPGRLVGGAVVLIIAGVEVDVAEGGTLFEAEGLWGPLEVAVGEDLGVGFLPGEGFAGPGGRAGDGEEVAGQQYGGDACEHGWVAFSGGRKLAPNTVPSRPRPSRRFKSRCPEYQIERPFINGGEGPFRVPGTRLPKKVR